MLTCRKENHELNNSGIRFKHDRLNIEDKLPEYILRDKKIQRVKTDLIWNC
jgi:hypothetical protein